MPKWEKALWTLQLASGLRATNPLTHIKPICPTLSLLGNIGNVSTYQGEKKVEQLLKKASSLWNTVYWVPGISEYSSDPKALPQDMVALRDTLREIASFYKVVLMDQTEVELPEKDIVILGLTGWCNPLTAVLSATPEPLSNLWVTDAGGQRRILVDDLKDLNADDTAWLKKRIVWWKRNRPGIRIVVLSHHSPIATSSVATSFDCMDIGDKYLASPLTPVSLWLAGRGLGNMSGMMGPSTFFCANDFESPHYMADRSASLEICLR